MEVEDSHHGRRYHSFSTATGTSPFDARREGPGLGVKEMRDFGLEVIDVLLSSVDLDPTSRLPIGHSRPHSVKSTTVGPRYL
jgi:hypothetical protein